MRLIYPMISNNQKKLKCSSHQQGFTLIELLVASAIGVIVLLAAGSTFFSTFRLKQQIQARVEYEQDLRVTANMMRRDARQLGNYSCMDSPTTTLLNSGDMAGAFDNANNKQSISTTLPSNFSTASGRLVADTNSTPLIMVSSSDLLANRVLALATGNADIDKNSCGSSIKGNQTLQGIIYVVATDPGTNRKGLYRLVYTNAGTPNLNAPQLMADNVVSMTQKFQYDKFNDNQCPKAPNDVNEALVWHDSDLSTPVDSLDFDHYQNPPVLITTTLTTCPNGTNADGLCKAQAGNTTNVAPPVTYEIKSMVRQGSVCAQHTLDE